MRLTLLLFICCTAVIAAPGAKLYRAQRIVGGSVTTIGQFPQVANVLFTWNWSTFEQYCGGTILSNRVILTAAHCIITHPANRFRVRLGSSLASSGGATVNIARTQIHPFYNSRTEDHDIALLHTATNIVFNNNTQPANLAGINYELNEHDTVFAVGWGAEWHNGHRSEELRQVPLVIINQLECARRYNTEHITITDNMLCAGTFDVGGRGQCQGDNGGPLFHNNVVVGVYSFTINCGVRFFPSVNVRISRVSLWLEANI